MIGVKTLGKKMVAKPLNYSVLIVVLIVAFIFFKKHIAAFFNWGVSSLNSVGSTLSNDEAQVKADMLFEAMDGLGTDYQTIKSVLSPLTESDYNKVSYAFGTPNYINGLGSFSSGGLFSVGVPVTLIQALNYELSSGEKTELKSLCPYLPF